MKLLPWVSLPTEWIIDGGLTDFKWAPPNRSDNLAALMVLMVIAHHTERETGEAKITYDGIADATGLSRSKIAAGLRLLEDREIIVANCNGQSTYKLEGYDLTQGWGKLPAAGLYSGGRIIAFDEFKLRNKAELDAIKLYLLFVALRDGKRNIAQVSYDKISDYLDIDRTSIRRGLTVLAANGLVHIEHLQSWEYEGRSSNGYRLAHLDSYRHAGTIGHQSDYDPTADDYLL